MNAADGQSEDIMSLPTLTGGKDITNEKKWKIFVS